VRSIAHAGQAPSSHDPRVRRVQQAEHRWTTRERVPCLVCASADDTRGTGHTSGSSDPLSTGEPLYEQTHPLRQRHLRPSRSPRPVGTGRNERATCRPRPVEQLCQGLGRGTPAPGTAVFATLRLRLPASSKSQGPGKASFGHFQRGVIEPVCRHAWHLRGPQSRSQCCRWASRTGSR
jgi:hypothetical protein